MQPRLSRKNAAGPFSMHLVLRLRGGGGVKGAMTFLKDLKAVALQLQPLPTRQQIQIDFFSVFYNDILSPLAKEGHEIQRKVERLVADCTRCLDMW